MKRKRTLSKREVLSFVMGAFNPLGYIGPALLQGKLLLRRLYGAGSPTWDEDLPKEEKRLWVRWLMELEEEAGVTMSRCVRPEGAIGEPSLAGFSDASASAMCAVVYVVWDAAPNRKRGCSWETSEWCPYTERQYQGQNSRPWSC